MFNRYEMYRQKGDDMYYSDKPIISNQDDLLNRKSFSSLLAKTLVELKNDDTFTVGLFGKWGTGKTSVVNMTLAEIEQLQSQDKEKMIVIHFEPWHFTDSTQLLTQFLIRLSTEFKGNKDKTIQKIGKEIEKYSGAFELAGLIPTYGGLIAMLAKFGFSKLGRAIQNSVDKIDILSKKESVVKMLSEQKSKILVVIDDIDRLSDEQIRSVFQLVSSVAKFPNTTYLLVFDKSIVVKALKNVQGEKGEEYLEKIIQMPIQIPEVPKSKLHEILFKRLDSIMLEHSNFLFFKEHWENIFNSCIEPFIKNLRDVNRLCNSLIFKLTTIYSEVDFGDMVAISLVEIGMPLLYDWIKIHKSLLTGESGWTEYSVHNKTVTEWHEYYSSELHRFFANDTSIHNIDECVDRALECLSQLFPCFGSKIGKTYEAINMDLYRRKNLISHTEKFDMYFNYDINLVGLTRASIEEAVYSLDLEKFNEFLLKEDDNNSSMAFIQEIKALLNDLPSERAKIIFTSLLTCAYKLNTTEEEGFLSLNTVTTVSHVCVDVLKRVNEDERVSLLSSVIEISDSNVIDMIAVFINIIELGYGRLAANGVERDFGKVITLEELERIEKIFVEKIKQILSVINLFDFSGWRMSLHLLQAFDDEYASDYLTKALCDNKNILFYLCDSVIEWTGTGVEYEIRDTYKTYLTEERILEAIEYQKESKAIFRLPKNILYKSVAFYLNSKNCKSYRGTVDLRTVEKTVQQWVTENK